MTPDQTAAVEAQKQATGASRVADALQMGQQRQNLQNAGYASADNPLGQQRPNPVLTAPTDNGSFSSRLSSALNKNVNTPGFNPNAIGGWQKLILGSTLESLAPKPAAPAAPPQEQQGQGQPRQAGWDQMDADVAARAAAARAAAANAPHNSGADLAIGAIDGAMKNFGDFASGVGAKGGIAGALLHGFQAHGKRLEEELRDHQQIATANAQLLHEQQLTRQLDDQHQAQSAALGLQGVAMFTDPSVPHPGTKISEGLTAGELAREVNAGTIQPWQDSIFHTGNRDGQPTYTAVRLPQGNISLDATQAKTLNDALGTNFTDGMTMKMSQLNQYWQDATNANTYRAAAKVAAEKSELDTNKMEASLRQSKLSQDSLVLQAVSQAAGAGSAYPQVTAYMNLLKNKSFLDSHLGFADDYPKSFGDDGKNFAKMQDDYNKLQAKNLKKVDEVLGWTSQQITEHSADALALANHILGITPEMNADQATTKAALAAQVAGAISRDLIIPDGDPRKQNATRILQAIDMRETATNAEAEEARKKTNQEIDIQEGKTNAAIGDKPELINAALNYDLDPEKQFG